MLLVGEKPALHELTDSTRYDYVVPSLTGSFPPEPLHPGVPPTAQAEPTWPDFAPPSGPTDLLGTLRHMLSSEARARDRKARARFEREKRDWAADQKMRERNQRDHERAVADYQREVADYRQRRGRIEGDLRREQARVNQWREKLEAALSEDLKQLSVMLRHARECEKRSIERLAHQLMLAIPLPTQFPREIKAHFDEVAGILLLTVQVPNVDELSLGVQLKTKARPANDKEKREAQEYVTNALALRLIHEIYRTKEFHGVAMVGVDLRLRYADRRTGQRKDEIIASLAATRAEFAAIDVAAVDPKLCFRALKGIATPSFQDVSPVRPVLSFDRDDKRIVESREVMDQLHADTNLAAMDWEDFEHVVRELFSKMFTARSSAAEVHVTRASRDYGVDALVHDPDPIHGGKFVIQAKRYVNTVEVSAVRDLYGTVQNEGANRGYIVTTSSFGPDAHQFAKGKPLTLIDGRHLLQLLKDHGYRFRIDLAEARRELHGR